MDIKLAGSQRSEKVRPTRFREQLAPKMPLLPKTPASEPRLNPLPTGAQRLRKTDN